MGITYSQVHVTCDAGQHPEHEECMSDVVTNQPMTKGEYVLFIEALRASGWTVTGDEPPNRRFYCPAHAACGGA